MSQFSMTMPIQTGDSPLKAPSAKLTDRLRRELEGDGEGVSFAQSLLKLSQSDANGAVLLQALQQSALLLDLPLPLQPGGTLLPSVTESDGNPLPRLQLQTQRLDSLTPPPWSGQTSLEPGQSRELLLPEQSAPFRAQISTAGAGGDLFTDDLQVLESRGLGNLTPQPHGLGVDPQHHQTVAAGRPVPLLPLQVPVGRAGWDEAVGERIQWMLGRNVQQAEIKLTPPELGPMEIKISLQNDQTSVHFLATHGATRDALEAAIPRLRELFGEINLNLANVDVSQRQAGGAAAHGGSAGNGEGSEGRFAEQGYELAQEGQAAALHLASRGLLDTYA